MFLAWKRRINAPPTDARYALQGDLGHGNAQHTVRYTELSPKNLLTAFNQV